MRRRWRVILSAIIFLAGLWAYLTVVEIRNPEHTPAFQPGSPSAIFWPAKVKAETETSSGAIKKTP
ncbi:MAG: hypothetical protein R3175_08775 [Marinobacter sp.]|uniref:hypothetical protein n=1 Tax=Marinobacter sp. TaxID=50741 RepID=UPI00299D48AB|nr:hypothetical protein [Marinobacter sp.]MDX1756137.1 hypothetical protein [Marinobacter sp.]